MRRTHYSFSVGVFAPKARRGSTRACKCVTGCDIVTSWNTTPSNHNCAALYHTVWLSYVYNRLVISDRIIVPDTHIVTEGERDRQTGTERADIKGHWAQIHCYKWSNIAWYQTHTNTHTHTEISRRCHHTSPTTAVIATIYEPLIGNDGAALSGRCSTDRPGV